MTEVNSQQTTPEEVVPRVEVVTPVGQCKRRIQPKHPYWLLFILVLKLVINVVGIICMICASPVVHAPTHWFMFVVVISFIGTLIWVFVYLLSIREALTLPINWILSEVFNTGILTVLYLIAFIVQLSAWTGIRSSYTGANIAAGVFGLFNTLAYGAGTYFLYAEWKSSTTQ